MISEETKAYYDLKKRNDVRESAKRIRRQFLRYKDIRFGLMDYYGGLHCGECLDVLIDDEWIHTRIEMGDDWFLVGVPTDQLVGLVVRI